MNQLNISIADTLAAVCEAATPEHPATAVTIARLCPTVRPTDIPALLLELADHGLASSDHRRRWAPTPTGRATARHLL